MALVAGSAAFVQARKDLDASLTPNSTDAIFVKLADRFDGFGGAYESEAGELVVVAKQPESMRAVQDALVADLFTMLGGGSKSRNAYLNKAVVVQPATYGFTDLAVYRNELGNALLKTDAVVFTDVDEMRNAVVIGVNEGSGLAEDDVLAQAVQLGIPRDAVRVERMRAPQATADLSSRPLSALTQQPLLTDYVRPLAGGLRLGRQDGACALGVPVWHGNPGNQRRGLLMTSHCTYSVGYNDGTQWGQPVLSNAIGVEFEDPPLTNCGTGSSNCDMTDVVLVDLNSAHQNSTMTLPANIHLTNFSSSTGNGGLAITGQTMPLGWTQSPLMGAAVNKVGPTSGWITGSITGTCSDIRIEVRHPDGAKRLTWLRCAIKASTPVRVGDSGSALFYILQDHQPDDGGFLGILSACLGCSKEYTSTTTYYVP